MIIPVDGSLSVNIPDINGGGFAESLSSFTPIIGGISESGQSYQYQQGYYTLSAHTCHVWAYIQFANQGSIIGQLRLKNLPVKVANIPVYCAGSCAYFSNASPYMANVSNILLYTSGTLDHALLFGFVPGQNPRPLVLQDINFHTQMILSLTYPVDTPRAS